MFLIPRIGWTAVPAEEAVELGLEQAGRWRWEIFRIEWLGLGIALMARPTTPA